MLRGIYGLCLLLFTDEVMDLYVLLSALLLPILGTALGAGGVFVKGMDFSRCKPYLLALSAGIMLASSFWSLLIPAFDDGGMSFPLLGLWLGVLFIIGVEKLTEDHLSACDGKSVSFMTAVTIHNIPEGIAVGVAAASALVSGTAAANAAALSLAMGIALQNIPEGAVISMPLYCGGKSKKRAFAYGILSGIAEPIFAFVALFFSGVVTGMLPFLLGFAAGAMIYVTVFDLLSDVYQCGGSKVLSVIVFFAGFTIMTAADMVV